MGSKRRKKFEKCFVCGASVREGNLFKHVKKNHPTQVGELEEIKREHIEEIKNIIEFLTTISDEKKLSRFFVENSESLIDMGGEYPVFWLALAESYLIHENYRKAKKCFEKALELEPRSKEASRGLNMCNEIIEDLRRKDWEEADIPELYDKLEEAMDMGLYKLADHLVNAVLKLDPEDIDALFHKGTISMNRGYLDKAKSIYLEVLRRDPECIETKGNLGMINTKLNNLKEAETYYNDFLEEYPKFVPAWHNLGAVYYRSKRYEKALDCFDTALRIDRRYYMGWFSKSQVLLTIGREKEATKCLKKANKLNPIYVARMLLDLEEGKQEMITYESGWEG